MLSEVGEIFFTIIVTYMGAVELAFLAKTFIHRMFHQNPDNDQQSLQDLQAKVEREIEQAALKELPGFKAMKDGVLYKDGFRVDPDSVKKEREVEKEEENLAKVDTNESTTRDVSRSPEMKRELIGASESADASELDADAEPDRTEAEEELCVKTEVNRLSASPAREVDDEVFFDNETDQNERTEKPSQTVHTQLAQQHEDLRKSADSSSNDPPSSTYVSSSLSHQGSSSVEAAPTVPELTVDEIEREDPDGQDGQELKYSEEYLRSLDGIKHRPLVRDDGTGRRRAFKKRHSIDSTSSRESRASREEELKMFTSLEEEEFEAIRRGDTDYVPIRYNNEPNLQVKKHHKRHRKSPIKVSRRTEEEGGSLSYVEPSEDQETRVDPWGHVSPEHYKDTEFWKREKAISIEEEENEEALNNLNLSRGTPSSFEDANSDQHEDAIKLIKEKESRDSDRKDQDKSKTPEEKVSTDDVSERYLDENGKDASYATTRSFDVDELTACHNESDELTHSFHMNSLRSEMHIEISHAPNLDWEQERSASVPRSFETDLRTVSEDFRQKSKSPLARSPSRPVTPKIEVEFTDHDSPLAQDLDEDEDPGELMEGVSDFYDFNAAINPSRSRSRSMSTERSSRKSKTPLRAFSSSPYRSIRPPVVPIDAKGVEGVSDFYDYCLNLNRKCYGHPANGEITHCEGQSNAELLLTKHELQTRPVAPKSQTKNELRLLTDQGGTKSKSDDRFDIVSEKATPTTPGSDISFVSVSSDIERMKDEYRSQAFFRSQYPGESMDFSDNYENLREEARYFRRSRSRSRSIGSDEGKSNRHDLQAKILEEISRTTISYQEFSQNINQKFIEHERRGSDSMLLHKPEVLIQIQDEQEPSITEENDDIMDFLEEEEYHHFRRFSLNQEYQVEEYPTDDCIFVEKVGVMPSEGAGNWRREDFYDPRNRPHFAYPLTSVESTDESDRAEADDLESGSDDERQTVVEVDDDIEEDFMEDHVIRSGSLEAPVEGDHACKEFQDESMELPLDVDHHYKEIQYQPMVEELPDEHHGEPVNPQTTSSYRSTLDIPISPTTITKTFHIDEKRDDRSPIKTEDLVVETLTEEERKYHWRARSDRYSPKESSAALLENESNFEAYLATATRTSPTTSKRLRSRYGVGTGSYSNYDVGDTYISEPLPAKPKKEYNWRKNFRLDDEDGETPKTRPGKLSFTAETKTEDEDDIRREGATSDDLLDPRKLSLGGESITLYTRSPDRIKDFDYTGSNFEEWEENGLEEATGITEADEGDLDKYVPEKSLEDVPQDNELDSNAIEYDVELNIKLPRQEQEEEEEYKLEVIRESSFESSKKSKKKKNKKKSMKQTSDERIAEEDSPERTSLAGDVAAPKKKLKKKRKSSEKEIDSPKKSPSPPASPPSLQIRGSKSTQAEAVAPLNPLNPPSSSKNLRTKSPPLKETQDPHEATQSPTIHTEAKSALPPSSTRISPSSHDPTSLATNQATHAPRTPSPSPIDSNKPKQKLERQQSSGAYELIKDGSMYPWF